MLEESGRDKRAYCADSGFSAATCCLTLDDGGAYCCRCAHRRRVSPLTCLAICVMVLMYNLLGGFIFLAIEGDATQETSVAASKPNLSQSQGSSRDLRAKTVERLWSITEDLNILYKENWTKLAAAELAEFERALLQSVRGEAGATRRRAARYRWTFSSSFLYALTLITTIGGGDVSPVSAGGKLVALAYACVGIPLVTLYLATVGDALARALRHVYRRLRAPRAPPRRAAGTGTTPFQAALNLDALGGSYHWACRDHTRVPISLSLILIALYVGLGTILFQNTEKWNFVEGCYFSFSSLATIGFGDLRPGLHASTVSAHAEDVAIGVCCVYILVGVVVVAMCFNLIHEDMTFAFRGVSSLFGPSVGPGPRAVHSVEKVCDDKISMSVVS